MIANFDVHRSVSGGIWMSGLRPEGKNTWHYTPSCRQLQEGPDVIQGATQSHILSWMLNTTAPFDQKCPRYIMQLDVTLRVQKRNWVSNRLVFHCNDI